MVHVSPARKGGRNTTESHPSSFQSIPWGEGEGREHPGKDAPSPSSAGMSGWERAVVTPQEGILGVEGYALLDLSSCPGNTVPSQLRAGNLSRGAKCPLGCPLQPATSGMA